jgi:hypothetical protein
MDSTQEYLIRAGQRNKILGDLDTSVMSEMDEEEVSYDTSERKLEENVQLDKADSNKTYTVESSDIPAIDASTTPEPVARSPLRPFNNRPTIIIQDSPAPTSPLKSKFGKLSQDYQNFEVDIKPTKTKEDYIRGPVKRISMGGEKTTAEFFAPKPHGSTSSATHSGNNSPALPSEQPASGATTSTPKSSALPVNTNLPLSPFSNHSSLNASDANETFNNTSMNGIFSFGRKLTNEPTISKIDEAPTKDHSSNVRAPFQPTLPFIAKSTSVENAPKPFGSTSSATHSGNNSPALPYEQPASGATFSSTSNYGKKTDDASSLKYGQRTADDLSSSKYGQKVDELKKKFDYPNKGLMPGNTIDSNRMDFGKAKSLFESAFQPTTRYQSPYAAKREQAVTNIRRYDHPNPTKKPAHCEIVTGPTFKQSVDYWQDRERAFPSSELVDPATQIFKGPTKRENSKGENVFYSTNQQQQHPPSYRNDMTSPSPKVSKLYDQPQTAMEQARKLVSFSEEFDGETGNRSTEPPTWKNEKNYGIKPLVVTESFTAFSTLASSKKSESITSFSVPSDSFDYQKPAISAKTSESADTGAPLSPFGPSLLDDINQDFTKVHTPVNQKAHIGGQGDAAAGDAKPALVYSLSNYRKSESTPSREPVKYDNKDVVKEIMSPEVRSSEEMYRKFSHEQIQKKLKQLELAQTVANNQIQQTEKALKVARHTNFKSNYPNYTQEVELLQTLQTLSERRRACYLEFGRISNASDLYYVFPRATLRFTKIAVDVHRHLDVAPNHYAYLFALVRYNEQVFSSQAVFINPMISQGVGSIEFSDIIEVEDVSPDFSMSIEIYGLTLVRKDSKYDTTRFNLKRMVSSPQPERHHSNETFSRIGQVVIDKGDLAQQVLDLSSHETPLVGHCRINFQPKITDIDDNKWSGFVSIYRVVDGKGAWELCYSNIQNNRLNFWRYPEDADTKPPILSINMRDMADLAKPCCNEKLGFQNDFEVKVIDASENKIQIMLSTAEERDRDRIISAINRSYKYIDAWRFS